jgi:hypothetical protein
VCQKFSGVKPAFLLRLSFFDFFDFAVKIFLRIANRSTGPSLWMAYTTGSKPGTHTRSGTTWTQTQ